VIEALERRRLLAVHVDANFLQPESLPQQDVAPDAQSGASTGFVEVLDDGKIVTGGVIDSLFDARLRVARFTTEGRPDTTFGGGDGLSDPIAIPQLNFETRGFVQPDGKIVLAASTFDGLVAARFNADGSIDSAFGGGDGVAVVNGFGPLGPSGGGMVQARLALAADGSIVLAGSEWVSDTFVATRIDANGALDTAFADNGRLIIHPGDILPASQVGDEIASADVAVLASGKILLLVQLGGSSDVGGRPALIRLNADGAYDTTFDGDGSARSSSTPAPRWATRPVTCSCRTTAASSSWARATSGSAARPTPPPSRASTPTGPSTRPSAAATA
jgi:uncharacterized delta-60 repeat protein